jgi:predicted thioesterase
VGTRLDVEHKAPTPVGLTVTARARLIEVDRRRLVFEVEASDDREAIAVGTHERFVLKSLDQFLERAAEKTR